MTGPEKITVTETLELQRAALRLLETFRGDIVQVRQEISQVRQEFTDFRHEIVGVVKDVTVRVDAIEDADKAEVIKAAAIGAVAAKNQESAERRWGFYARLFGIVSAATGVGASLAIAGHNLGLF